MIGASTGLPSIASRPVAQLAEQRSPKPQVGGSIPSWPAKARGPDLCGLLSQLV